MYVAAGYSHAPRPGPVPNPSPLVEVGQVRVPAVDQARPRLRAIHLGHEGGDSESEVGRLVSGSPHRRGQAEGTTRSWGVQGARS